MQQLILGTGTAIWWLTEPHWAESQEGGPSVACTINMIAIVNDNFKDNQLSGLYYKHKL